MSYTVEVDEGTYRSVEFAARIAGVSMGQVVARLVAETGATDLGGGLVDGGGGTAVAIYCDYEGHRTNGRYDRLTQRVDITSGPLSGKSFKTPSGAAIAVVRHYKPTVNPNRNGWEFWIIDDGSRLPVQSIRHSG